MLLVYKDGGVFKIHAVPSEAQDFALPQPGKDGDIENKLVRVTTDLFEKGHKCIVLKGLYLGLFNAGQHNGI